MSISIIFRALLIAAASLGAYSGGVLSLEHLHTGEACPLLGPVPACMLVFAGYAAIIISALLPRGWFTKLFYLGWTPVFGLALVGAVLHTFVSDTCPVNESGMPKCYMSLALAALMFVFAFLGQRKSG
jgi:hypothetical protein